MPDVTVKLSIGAFAVEVSGPSDYVDKKLDDILSRYLTAARPSSTEVRTPSIPLEKGGKQLSAGELLKKSRHKNQSDEALLLAYYLEKQSGLPSFTSTELGNLAREVKRPFSNASDVVAKLTARGLMMSTGDREGQRAYALTASGEELVESMLEEKS